MAKQVESAGIVSPANLWGKPLPRTPNKPTSTEEEEKGARMLPETADEIDSDVEAELEDEEIVDDAELTADESVEVEDTVVETAASVAGDDDNADEDEDDEFDAEVGDEDEDEDEDEDVVDSAVDVDEVPVMADKAVTTPKATKKMAEKKSISDHVRDEIAERKAAGDSLRGVDIVNALAKRRIKVSPAQVSQLLKKAGVSQKARGPRRAVAVAAAGEERSRDAKKVAKQPEPRKAPKIRGTTGTTAELPWKQLNAAKAFIAACNGSFDEASDTLAMFQKIESVLHN